LGCYGVQLTRPGREGIESRAGEGDEDRLTIGEAGELVVVVYRELDRSEVEPLAGVADEVADVEVGLERSGAEDCLEGTLDETTEEGRGGRSSITGTGYQGREA